MKVELTFENIARVRRKTQFKVPYLTLEQFIADTRRGLLNIIELIRRSDETIIEIKDLY
nr:MAG TPA: hypothetical protein [Microviridae sp.]